MKMPIIALGRQFGSGGREIGKHLAEKLQVRCYDRELITLAAQKAEVREELFAGKEEKAPNPWLFTGVYEGGPQVRKGQPAEDILFEMQSQVILELARMGILPEGMYRNRQFAQCAVEPGDVELAVQDMLYDPQTAGGLLMAVDPEDADALEAELKKTVPSAQRVGTVHAYESGPRIILR